MYGTKHPALAGSKSASLLAFFVAAILLLGNAPVLAQETTSVTLTWTAPGDDGSTGTASQYDVRYSTSPITGNNWNSATQATGEPDPQPAGSPESFTITGLQPSTTYYFAIMTADEVGNWSALSNVASIATDDTMAPAAIVDLSASSGD